jgi:hypothetical protein
MTGSSLPQLKIPLANRLRARRASLGEIFERPKFRAMCVDAQAVRAAY